MSHHLDGPQCDVVSLAVSLTAEPSDVQTQNWTFLPKISVEILNMSNNWWSILYVY